MYDHRAVEYVPTGRDVIDRADLSARERECLVCGRAVTGIGSTLRHLGEEVRLVKVEPEDARVFHRAIDVGRSAVRKLPSGATPEDVMAAVLAAMYADGLMRRRRGERHGLAESDAPDPTHARYEVERA